MSAIKIDERELMQYLLRQLSFERLDTEGAAELKPLLERELQTVTDPKYKRTLQRLINLLDKYIRGEINLMPLPDFTVSNVT
jgi:hypothetical protein